MIYLVIPCYNETQRLNPSEFLNNSNFHFVFVDDGSQDGTADFIHSTIIEKSTNNTLLRMTENKGKASSIYNGIKYIQQQFPLTAEDWVGFLDADLATPIAEVESMVNFAKWSQQNPTSVWASRIYRYGAKIQRSALRHYLGRAFATLIHWALEIEAYDTQCGAKVFKPEVLNQVFSEPFISPWIFDVEIALRLEQKRILEYPLQKWADVPGSKLKISKEIFRVLRDIYRIRSKYVQ